jgi:PKD repeat protein
MKGSVSNVKNRSDIIVTLDDSPFEGFNFVPGTGEISSVFKFNPGSHTIKVTVKNDCGSDSKTASVSVQQPCLPPQLSINLSAVNREDATHEMKGSVSNVKNRSDISVTLDDSPFEGFAFVPGTGEINSVFKFNPGSYTIKVSVKNDCGSDSKTASVSVQQPCLPPQVSINLSAVNREDATHEMKGSVSNVKNKSDISVTVNDNPFEGFTFVPGTGEISSVFKLNPGSYTIKVSVKSDCGSDTYSGAILIEEEKPCGIRINPGNSSWEFCMVTPTGTIERDTLTNNNFRYSGQASSLYFMPIAGGGDAVVKGKPYSLRPGQYYLFTGNLMVTISTKNPGSMGQWSVCIIADKEPLSGNGNNRPKSPCEEQEDKGKSKKIGE